MIENWMKNQSVSDCSSNIVNLNSSKFFLQEMTNNVGLTFSVSDNTPQFTIIISEDYENW